MTCDCQTQQRRCKVETRRYAVARAASAARPAQRLSTIADGVQGAGAFGCKNLGHRHEHTLPGPLPCQFIPCLMMYIPALRWRRRQNGSGREIPCVTQIRCVPAQPGTLFPMPGVIVPAIIAIGRQCAACRLIQPDLSVRRACNVFGFRGIGMLGA